MNGMFANCSSLTFLDLSNFKTSNAYYLQNFFSGCTNLKSLDISSFSTSNAASSSRNISGFFSNCSNLEAIKLGNKSFLKTDTYHTYFPTAHTGTIDGKTYTGKWTYNSAYNHINIFRSDTNEDGTTNTTPWTATELRDNYIGGNMAGWWKMEIEGKDPDLQSYTSIKANVLGEKFTSSDGTETTPTASDYLNPLSEVTKTHVTEEVEHGINHTQKTDNNGELVYEQDVDGNDTTTPIYDEAGYWTRISNDTWTYTFAVYSSSVDDGWYVWEDVDDASGENDTITINGETYHSEGTKKHPIHLESKVADGSITNTSDEKQQIPLGKLTVAKDVLGSDGSQVSDQSKNFSFTMTLTDADGNSISGSTIYGGTVFKDGVGKFNLTDGDDVTSVGSIVFDGIPIGYHYSITEDSVDGYQLVSSALTSGVIDNSKDGITASFTNQKEETPPKDDEKFYNLSVNKKLVGNYESDDSKYPFLASFSGLHPNTEYSYQDLEVGTEKETITKHSHTFNIDKSFTSDKDGNADVSFSLKGDQTATFQSLPEGSTYQLTEEGGDYTASYIDSNGERGNTSAKNTNLTTATTILTSDSDVTYTNNISKTQNLKLKKKVVNHNGIEVEDTESYPFTIQFSNLKSSFSSTIGKISPDVNGKATLETSLKGKDEIVFSGIPVGTKYQIIEEKNDKKAYYEITDGTTVEKSSDCNADVQTALSTSNETVNQGEDATVIFTNQKTSTVCLKIRKYDAEATDQELSGAVYGLYQGENLVKQITLEEPTEDGDYNLIDGLSPGTYTLKEITPPAGYLIDLVPKTIVLTNDEIGTTVTQNVYDTYDYQYSFGLFKKGSTVPLAGTKFQILSYDGTNWTNGGTIETGKDGTAVFPTRLRSGVYVLKETQSPEGYTLGEDRILVVDAKNKKVYFKESHNAKTEGASVYAEDFFHSILWNESATDTIENKGFNEWEVAKTTSVTTDGIISYQDYYAYQDEQNPHLPSAGARMGFVLTLLALAFFAMVTLFSREREK